MARCNRFQSLDLGDGYGLAFFQRIPPPKARTFELPDDTVHYAPDRPADVKHVKIEVTLDFEQETVSGKVSTTFQALYDELKTLSFDAIELSIEQVTLADGTALNYHTTDKKLLVSLNEAYSYGEEFTIIISYHAKPRIGMNFNKPGPDDPTRPVQAWSFGQPQYHSYWFPCHDFPNDRATTEILATVPAQFQTIANGNLLGITDNGETRTHHWLHNVPHAAYLISLVVGDFAVIEDSYNGKPVTYYVRKDRKDDVGYYLGKTPEMMRFFSEYSGVEYPYDSYAQTVVELYMGAMEHTTATTHSFALLLDEKAALDIDYVPVTAHELAHQWFGDLVTCRDWSNGWLNEGFATYFESLWVEHDRGNDYFKLFMSTLKETYLAEDRYYRRPIVYHVYHRQGFELFDAHMYQKGSWVLHMLRHQLGEAAFRRAVKSYLERNRTREVVTADLERAFEESTGRSLARFFQQWVYSGGYPAFQASYEWDSEHKLAKIAIKQTQEVNELTPCFVTPVDLAFTIPGSDEADAPTRVVEMRVTVGEDGQIEQSFYVALEREPLMIRFDPNGWLLKTLKFARPASMVRYQLANDPDVLGRIEAAEALASQGSPESFMALLVALNSDPFPGVRVAAAQAIGGKGNKEALDILLGALRNLDATRFSTARAAIAAVLGRYQAPQQAELAERAAEALRSIIEQGDVSYRVEMAAATALGKTRTPGCIDVLEKRLQTPSWMTVVESAALTGLAYTGEDRAVEIINRVLTDPTSPPLLRRGAGGALSVVGQLGYLYSEAERQRAVTAACTALEQDYWPWSRARAAAALQTLKERRAIPVLEAAEASELDDGALRSIRLALHSLRSSDTGDEQIKQLRKDIDELREENRGLKEQLGALEARLP